MEKIGQKKITEFCEQNEIQIHEKEEETVEIGDEEDGDEVDDVNPLSLLSSLPSSSTSLSSSSVTPLPTPIYWTHSTDASFYLFVKESPELEFQLIPTINGIVIEYEFSAPPDSLLQWCGIDLHEFKNSRKNVGQNLSTEGKVRIYSGKPLEIHPSLMQAIPDPKGQYRILKVPWKQ